MKTKKKRSDVTNQQIDSTIPCVGSIFLATDGVKMWLELRRGTRGAAQCVTEVLTIFPDPI